MIPVEIRKGVNRPWFHQGTDTITIDDRGDVRLNSTRVGSIGTVMGGSGDNRYWVVRRPEDEPERGVWSREPDRVNAAVYLCEAFHRALRPVYDRIVPGVSIDTSVGVMIVSGWDDNGEYLYGGFPESLQTTWFLPWEAARKIERGVWSFAEAEVTS